MNIDIIKVPLFYGCDREGVELGPQTLMDNGLAAMLERYGNHVRDKGFINVPQVAAEDKNKNHPRAKYLDAVAQSGAELANLVAASLKEGRLPLTLGGDHALALGSLAGTSQVNGNDMGVIWIDAHTDVNTTETTHSANIHGMPLAASLGEGHEKLVNLFYEGRKVEPGNCFIIGARSMDEGELLFIQRLGIKVWHMEEVREKGMGIIILELLELLNQRGISKLHVSYDIDSLDASLVPGTGTPEEDGLWFDESIRLIQAILGTGLVRSVDFVEFNPVRDRDDQTLKAALRMLEAFAQGLGELGGIREQAKTA